MIPTSGKKGSRSHPEIDHILYSDHSWVFTRAVPGFDPYAYLFGSSWTCEPLPFSSRLRLGSGVPGLQRQIKPLWLIDFSGQQGSCSGYFSGDFQWNIAWFEWYMAILLLTVLYPECLVLELLHPCRAHSSGRRNHQNLQAGQSLSAIGWVFSYVWSDQISKSLHWHNMLCLGDLGASFLGDLSGDAKTRSGFQDWFRRTTGRQRIDVGSVFHGSFL